MIPDGTYTAVVDRFENSDPVLEVSGDGERYELAVEQQALPQPARHVDAVLEIEVIDGELTGADYKPDESEERLDDAQSRFDRLSKRPPKDDDSE